MMRITKIMIWVTVITMGVSGVIWGSPSDMPEDRTLITISLIVGLIGILGLLWNIGAIFVRKCPDSTTGD